MPTLRYADLTFPEKLWVVRHRRGMTQLEFARMLGVSERTVSRAETGRGPTEKGTLARMLERWEIVESRTMRRKK